MVLRLRAADTLEVKLLQFCFHFLFVFFITTDVCFGIKSLLTRLGLTFVFCLPQASGNHTFVQLK